VTPSMTAQMRLQSGPRFEYSGSSGKMSPTLQLITQVRIKPSLHVNAVCLELNEEIDTNAGIAGE